MYKEGRGNKFDNDPKKLEEEKKKKELENSSKIKFPFNPERNNIDFKQFSKGQITIDYAY
jgi:hypothetical protein